MALVNQVRDENVEESHIDFGGENGAAGGDQKTMGEGLWLVWNPLKPSRGRW